MHLDKILTKDFLQDQLITKKISIMELSTTLGCSKHSVIDYCKKHLIYEEIKSNRKHLTEDLTGHDFYDLTVVCQGKNDRFNKTRWVCICKCGREKLINSASLKRGLTKSCGFCHEVHNFKGYQDISGTYWKNLQRSAAERGYIFDITVEYVWGLFLQQNKKCALSGIEVYFYKNQDKPALQTASIDRIDSTMDYVENNIQIIHKRLQLVKSVLSNNELIYWCKLIYNNHTELANNIKIDVENLSYLGKHIGDLGGE